MNDSACFQDRGQPATADGLATPRGEAVVVPLHEEVGLRQYLEPVLARWRLVAFSAVVAMAAAALISKLALRKWYKAAAVMRPVQGLGSLSPGSLNILAGGGASLLSDLAGNGRLQQDSMTYIAILKSFYFTTEVIREYHLAEVIREHRPAPLFNPSGGANMAQTAWERYEILKGRFDAEYDFRTGNITLEFVDPDPAVARRILGYYIDRLRVKLRNQEIDQARTAVTSLEREAGQTSDALLQGRLYELIAEQLQRKVVAEVQADFAFVVIEPPFVPDRAYWPRTAINSLAAGLLVTVVLGAGILVASRASGSRKSADGVVARRTGRRGV